MLLSEALAHYATQLQADGRSPHTTAQAKRHVRLLIAALGDRAVDAVKHEDIAKFLASDVVRQRADGAVRKASSANALRSSLRSFLAFVHAAGYSTANTARLVRRARVPSPRPKALSEADCAKLVAALEQAESPTQRRDRVLFLVMLRAGLRLGSAVGLDVEDVDLDARELRIRTIKGGGEVVAFVPDDIVELLRDWIGARTSGPMFRAEHGARLGTRQVRRRLAYWGERAAIGAVHPHQLRHTAATRAYRKTRDLLVTARILNHRSVSSTQIYAHADEDAVRRAIA